MSEDLPAYIAKLRPSRDRAVLEGKLFWTEVDVLDIEGEGQAIRNALEKFFIKVNLYLNGGLASGIIAVLGKNQSKADYVILSAHGEDGDIVLPELGEEIAAAQPFTNKMTPKDLEKFVDVKDKIVINTSCDGGDKKLADAFLKEGKAKAYIADTYAPFSYVSFLFPVLIFYFLTKYPDIGFNEAFERAKSCDPEEFKTWQILEGQTWRQN